jgi:hypothetical protein
MSSNSSMKTHRPRLPGSRGSTHPYRGDQSPRQPAAEMSESLLPVGVGSTTSTDLDVHFPEECPDLIAVRFGTADGWTVGMRPART